MKLAVVQHAAPTDPGPVPREVVEGVREAAAGGAELVLLPELHNGPYFCIEENPAHFDLAEPVPGPTTDGLGQLAAELGVVIVGSVFERRLEGVYHNTAVVLDADGRLAGRYRKMHIPDDPGYFEKYYFAPGDLGFRPIDTRAGRLGVLICWDQWFPEAARILALRGAEVLLYPSAIGWNPAEPEDEQARQLEAWTTIQRAHAVANHLPLAAANRVGLELRGREEIRFWGNSFICGPQGEPLATAGAGPAVIQAHVDPRATTRLRREWPFLRDRRVDAYADLLQRALPGSPGRERDGA